MRPTFAARTQDCLACAGLLVEQLREHGVLVGVEPLRRLLEQVVADERLGFVQVARDGDQVVGVAYVARILSMEHAGPAAWLEELYVMPAWRQQGVGTALLSAVVERTRATGMAAIDLEIDSGHTRAASLYGRFGFCRLDRSRWVRKLQN